MNRSLHLAIAAAAGLLGGIVSTYLAPALVHAQTTPPVPAMIAAQRFLLMSDKGQRLGEISVDSSGKSSIRLFDTNGRVLWSAGGEQFKPLGTR
jgi:hypothetical protein